ncbi:MAG: glyoxylase-like metal-dependent hydrolase (beta-lactamase superfamily II) [Candidatus Krumholzibacteriia bacterium]
MATSPTSSHNFGRDDLHLIDLDQELPGQRRFISCWVSVAAGRTYVVDPGPSSTADYLIRELERLGVESLDYILLTHVHLDHGGCTALILRRWPKARVICHPRGRRHLMDPARLWAGSQSVLGHKAEVYGEPLPVPAESLAENSEAEAAGITVIDTPGHAPHHHSFVDGKYLFLGECAGTFSTLEAGPLTADYYLRPATPPRFRLETALASLDSVLALDPFPTYLMFAHHGHYAGDTKKLITEARQQLILWTDVVRQTRDNLAALSHTEQPENEDALMDLLRAELRRADPHFALGTELPTDIRERERDFTSQTLRGILGYLQDAL